jgi:hypothetical protein
MKSSDFGLKTKTKFSKVASTKATFFNANWCDMPKASKQVARRVQGQVVAAVPTFRR